MRTLNNLKLSVLEITVDFLKSLLAFGNDVWITKLVWWTRIGSTVDWLEVKLYLIASQSSRITGFRRTLLSFPIVIEIIMKLFLTHHDVEVFRFSVAPLPGGIKCQKLARANSWLSRALQGCAQGAQLTLEQSLKSSICMVILRTLFWWDVNVQTALVVIW